MVSAPLTAANVTSLSELDFRRSCGRPRLPPVADAALHRPSRDSMRMPRFGDLYSYDVTVHANRLRLLRGIHRRWLADSNERSARNNRAVRLPPQGQSLPPTLQIRY